MWFWIVLALIVVVAAIVISFRGVTSDKSPRNGSVNSVPGSDRPFKT